ncbi:MAG: LacI family transcriptional regulator [Cytophagales bacterium]|nr:LacI family transcriptional regulator [Cytophagales bacterium]
MQKEITIYDLADKLNLSASTVSRALNDHPAINPETKKKVNDAAVKFGYRLNRFAQNLRAQSTKTIGVIVPRLDSHFMAMVLAGMEKVANEAGYNLLITQSLESQKKEVTNASTMFNSRVDGLLVSVAHETTNFEHFDPFFKKKIPTIFFDRVLDLKKAPKIIIDNFQAGYDATKHLIDEGRKNIWHVTGDLTRNVYDGRLKGYMKALADHELPFSKEKLHITKFSINDAALISELIVKAQEKPDGIFCTNDTCASSILMNLKRLGFDIPKDIAIIGFNDDTIAQVVEPRLSTVNYPAEKMGEVAARSLIQKLTEETPVTIPEVITLKHELIIRGSSKEGAN